MKTVRIVFTGKETHTLIHYDALGIIEQSNYWIKTALDMYEYGWRYTFEYFVR